MNCIAMLIDLLKLGDIYRLRLVVVSGYTLQLLYRMLKLGRFPEILSFTTGAHEYEIGFVYHFLA